MAYRFRTELAFRWRDIDSFGVVNNAVFLTLFEQVRYEYFEHLGLLTDGNISFFLGETRVRYLEPGRLGMRVAIGARTTRLGTKSFDMEFEVLHEERTLVAGTAALVWVDRALQSVAIPEHARLAISEFEGIPG